MNSRENPEENLAQAFSQLSCAVKEGAQWIFLPELFLYLGPYDALTQIAQKYFATTVAKCQEFCKREGVSVFLGSLPEPANNKTKVYNTQVVVSSSGECLATYRKTHLFSLRDNRSAAYDETAGFLAGSTLSRLSLDGFTLGLATCYDLRFPEFFCALAQPSPLDVLVIPSAFTLLTGMDHWHVLLRARAIEWQCYVVAANQTGKHSQDKLSYGHSLTVDPWGHVLADTGDGSAIALSYIQRSKIEETRRKIPALGNRRQDLTHP